MFLCKVAYFTLHYNTLSATHVTFDESEVSNSIT